MQRSRWVAGLAVAGTLATSLAFAGPASASPAAPHQLHAWQSVGTISPKGHTPNEKTGLGGLCLSVLQFTPGSALWLEPCNPAEDAAQTWVLTILYGTVESWSLLAHPDICVGGVPAYSDYATTYDCAEPTPEDVKQGIALYGGTRGGVNWFRNNKGVWLTGHNTEGRVEWLKAGRTILQILLRRGPNQGWIANNGYEEITIEARTHHVGGDAIHGPAHGLIGYIAVGTISPLGHSPDFKRGKFGLCLTALGSEPYSGVWLLKCVPGDQLQEWTAHTLAGLLTISLTSYPDVELAGLGSRANPGDVRTYDGTIPRDRLINGMYITGVPTDSNGIQSAVSRLWMSGNRAGPAEWHKGPGFFQRLFGAKPQQWTFNGDHTHHGWQEVSD